MKKYINTLSKLDLQQSYLMNNLIQNSTQHTKVVLILSGSSSLSHSELSEVQQQFLQNNTWNEYQTIEVNFPYNKNFRNKTPEFPNLLQASWQNIVFFLHCLFNPKLKNELIRHLQPVFNTKEVIIISLSSGLNMLTIALPFIQVKSEKVTLFALGPVSFKRFVSSGIRFVVIKGKKDWYSRVLDRHVADYLINCDHFHYLYHAEVQRIINEER